MLPINIVANCCSAEQPLELIHQALRESIPDSKVNEYASGGRGISWREYTHLTFRGTEWYTIEGSLTLEGQRAVLYREDSHSSNKTQMIMIALLPTSLVHLKSRVSTILNDSFKMTVSPLEFPLGELARVFVDRNKVSGFAIANANGDGRIFIQGGLLNESEVLVDKIVGTFAEFPDQYSISELYLQNLGPRETDVVLYHDGSLSFNNPGITLDDIDDTVSEIAESIQQDSHSKSSRHY